MRVLGPISKQSSKGTARILEASSHTSTASLTHPKHDLAFHNKIPLATGNSVFAWFQQSAVTVVDSTRSQGADSPFARHLDRAQSDSSSHQAIEAHDPDAARAAMLEHLKLMKFYAEADVSA